MVPQLMQSFHINAAQIGMLSAFFYYPYIIMQVPVGIIYDTYSVHKVLTLMVLTCALGALLFTITDSYWVLIIGRIFMGFSAAFAFIGTLKIATLRFKSSMLGLLAGLTQGMGMLGATVSEQVFGSMVEKVGWRFSMGIISAILFLIAVLMVIFLHDKYLYSKKVLVANQNRKNYFQKLYLEMKIVFSNLQSWANAIYAGLVYAPTGAFAALWGISFLEKNYHLDVKNAALITSMIFMGLAIGGPCVGWLSDRIGKRRPLMFICSLTACVTLSMIIYIPHLPILSLYILALIYGVSNSGVSLAYAVAGEINPRETSGLSIAFTNMFSILTVPGLQQIVGWLLVLGWTHHMESGIPVYSVQDYRHAMFALPIISFVSFLCVFLIKETHCKNSAEDKLIK